VCCGPHRVTRPDVPSPHDWGLVFTVGKDVSLAGLAEGAVVKVCDSQTRGYRIGRAAHLRARWASRALPEQGAKFASRRSPKGWTTRYGRDAAASGKAHSSPGRATDESSYVLLR
jgi:hypothetical protein